VKTRLKYLQRCRNLLNQGAALFQDRDRTLAIADRSECPVELKTASRLAKSRAKARELVAARCSDTLVGAFAACGETVDEIVCPTARPGASSRRTTRALPTCSRRNTAAERGSIIPPTLRTRRRRARNRHPIFDDELAAGAAGDLPPAERRVQA
jgi:hypothetical protein